MAAVTSYENVLYAVWATGRRGIPRFYFIVERGGSLKFSQFNSMLIKQKENNWYEHFLFEARVLGKQRSTVKQLLMLQDRIPSWKIQD